MLAQALKSSLKRFSKPAFLMMLATLLCALTRSAVAQNDCAEGDGVLDMTPPKDIAIPDIIQKFTAQESKVKEARAHYTYTQDVMVQTLGDNNSVSGQFHEVTKISYDDKGKREENVSYAEQSTLRGVELSAQDKEDIREFMPLILSADELPQYNVTFAGQQHVDDLDTYIFHVVPKKEEKNKRYFEGRIWVDNHDLQIVKVCGKSVPDVIHAKRNRAQEIRPTFATYRQPVDGNWFPAYVRVDDTLHFRAESVHVREIVKFTGYKRAGAASSGGKQ
jgi:outer membrane lipoprotein-sorting protein